MVGVVYACAFCAVRFQLPGVQMQDTTTMVGVVYAYTVSCCQTSVN